MERQSAPGTLAKPDLRFLQANERTALAWVRTGVALMAFGFVIARLGLWLRQSGQAEERWEALWLGAGFIVAGALCNLVASFRFARIRRALVEGRDAVPGGTAVVALALAVTILGGLLIAYVQVFPQ